MNRTIYTIVLTAAAAFAVAALAGCGSDSGTASSAAAPLTKKEFMRQGNALCKKAVAEESTVYQEFVKEAKLKGEPTKQEFEEFATTEILPIAKRMVDELDELGAPRGEQAALEKLLEEFEEGLTVAESDLPRFFSGEAFKAADDSADEYGLTDCGV